MINDLLEFIVTDKGLELLGIAGTALVTLGFAIRWLLNFLKKDVSTKAKNNSVAAGRDAHVRINLNEKGKRK